MSKYPLPDGQSSVFCQDRFTHPPSPSPSPPHTGVFVKEAGRCECFQACLLPAPPQPCSTGAHWPSQHRSGSFSVSQPSLAWSTLFSSPPAWEPRELRQPVCWPPVGNVFSRGPNTASLSHIPEDERAMSRVLVRACPGLRHKLYFLYCEIRSLPPRLSQNQQHGLA